MDTYTLRDKHGRVFTMAVGQEDPFGSRWWVLSGSRRKRGQAAAIGYVEAVRMPDDPPDTLTLADIRIEVPSDRHGGLGTALLGTLFSIAQRQGVRYIHGLVTPKDQHATPGLLDWYRREGFSVRPGGNSALIHIDLHDGRSEREE
ncbi:MAG: hypothetical protein IVW55_04055 [Chloroflexi bacterium]|nr:hypothetical protein [Chloroflexota bacterium]